MASGAFSGTFLACNKLKKNWLSVITSMQAGVNKLPFHALLVLTCYLHMPSSHLKLTLFFLKIILEVSLGEVFC